MEKALLVTLIKVVDLAIMISITNYLLVPRLLYQKKYSLFIGCFIAMVLLSSIAKMHLLGRVLNSPQLYDFSSNLKARVYDNMLPHFFLVMAGAAIKLMMDYGRLQQRILVVAKEKAEAELNFLKSQINPHFMFNSLNAVYFLIDKSNAAARTALHQFSALLRYQLYEMNDTRIPIEKEIRFLQDYVALQQLRTNDTCSIVFDCDPAVKNFTIEPLLLIPFVENAFKHLGQTHPSASCIHIAMAWDGLRFVFNIKNTMDTLVPTDAAHQGIGLKNVRQRLAILYPGKHTLVAERQEQLFVVALTIQLEKAPNDN